MLKSSKLMVYKKDIFALLSLKYGILNVERNTDDDRFLVFFYNRTDGIERDFQYLQKAFAEKDLTTQLLLINQFLLDTYKHRGSSNEEPMIEDIEAYLELMKEKYK